MEDEYNLAAAIPLPSTPQKERAPLGEITNNVQEDVISLTQVDFEAKPTKKASTRGRKAKASKKGKKGTQPKNEEGSEVLEDENQSDASSAVEEACLELMKGGTGEIVQVPMHDLIPNSPPSKAVQAARKQLTPKMPTTSSSPNVHPLNERDVQAQKENMDSSLKAIESPTPAKGIAVDIIDEGKDKYASGEQLNEIKDDSFVKQIITRTPLKPVNRIEDSVEAIDALEDAIEKVGESLPDLKTALVSPIKSQKVRKAPLRGVQAAKKVVPNNTGKASSTTRTSISHKTPIKPSSSKVAPATGTKTQAFRPNPTKKSPPPKGSQFTKDRVMPTILDNASSATKPVRVSSITKAPFQPAKSTKPPTRSTFTLPGEAIAQKLKLQREERLKHEEEENAKTTTFKARPVPARLSMAPTVKSTLASKARMSLAQGEKLGSELGRKSSGPVVRSAGRVSSVSSTKANVNGPSATSDAATKRRVTMSVLGSNKLSPSTTTTSSTPSTRKPSISQAPFSSRTSVLPAEAKTLTLKGKEVFNRGKMEVEERERAKREKEEKARQARKEAAERGRAASREWAERRRRRRGRLERGCEWKSSCGF
ncbi:MAG: hypothetical protein Q9187_004251 [Circinaria calcarea]